ncbi:MAG: HNH endonuclease [Gemmatimonadaceae bacterium]|nr:HNH endonuclease [Gemmatimonadaceae bacterium]
MGGAVVDLDEARVREHLRERARGRIMHACAGCGRRCEGSRCPACQVPSPYATAEYREARKLTLATEHVCWICERPGTVKDPLTADHLVPVVRGGRSHRTQLRAAHRSCNARRGAAITNGGDTA